MSKDRFSKPNREEDKILSIKEIQIEFPDRPAIDPSTGDIVQTSILHYDAELYQRASGSKYYIFKHYDDCTLFIMNCNKPEYDEIKRFIELDDKIDIWITFPEEASYILIAPEYRHKSKYEEMRTIVV